MGKLLDDRRHYSSQRLSELSKSLTLAASTAGENGCVYLTGSFARGEAGNQSDLDLFIVGVTDDKGTRRLTRLNEIIIKADLIQATRAEKFPDFSGDGQYLVHYTVRELCDKLGEPDDDAVNTFTARMLLLLESRSLVPSKVYEKAITDVIAEYWGDFEAHPTDFLPAFLANDIVRMWKTFCVNYEARTENVPDEARAKRKLHNYKLKHSRMLTCYSALLYLCHVHGSQKTVAPGHVIKMASMSPTNRLEWIKGEDASTGPIVDDLLGFYERFLAETDFEKKELINRFLDKDRAKEYAKHARQFGDRMYDLLSKIGEKTDLFRYIVV